MANYVIRTPNGRSFRVAAPDDADEPTVWGFIKSLAPDLQRQAGLTGRIALQGLGDVAGIVGNPIAAMTGARYPRDIAVDVANEMGLPQPETPREKLVNVIGRGMTTEGTMTAGALGLSRLPGLIGKAGQYFGTQPGLQMASTMGGITGSELAKQEGYGPAVQLAAGVAGSTAPSFAMQAVPVSKIFIGKGAKIWDKAKAALAEKMEQEGRTPQDIWANTGTFRGVDKQWRQEIPDNAMTYRGSKAAGSAYADEVINHPELFKSYPGLGAARIREVPGELGSYESHPMGGFGTLTIGKDKNSSRTAVHELQHAIQERENFARGGSPSEFFNESVEMIEARGIRANDALERAKAAGGIDPETGLSVETLKNNVEGLWEKYLELKNQPRINPYKAYEQLAGETEARLTEARMAMTPAERAARFPPSMYDVPPEQQIVRFNTERSMSVPKAAAKQAVTNKPLASKGMISYRYQGQYGPIMIGAKNNEEALQQAMRSTDAKININNLEIWNGEKYVPAKK